MKKSLLKNNFKTIVKTRRRFLSILAMAFLGVGFYSGLVASSPDMLNSLDKYTDTSNMFDISIVSTLGLTSEDIEELNKIDGVEQAYGIQTKDSFVMFDDKESICKVIEYNENINKPVVIEGRLPESVDECLLDAIYNKGGNYAELIGKTLIIENNDKDEDDNEIFTQKEFKVVGIVQTPLYISTERGNTNIGSGNIGFFIYTKEEVINLDCYTQIDLKISGAAQEVTNSEKYTHLVDDVMNKIEDIKEDREQSRYDELVSIANKKIDDAQSEFDEEKAKVEEELRNAENKINTANEELKCNEDKIKKSEEELISKEQSAKNQFKEAQRQIDDGIKQLEEKAEMLNTSKIQFENAKTKIQATLAQIDFQINQIKMMEQTEETQIQILTLETQKSAIEETYKQQEMQIVQGEKEIQIARQELEKNQNQLNVSKKQAEQEIADAKVKISNAKRQLASGKAELRSKEQEYLDGKKEAEEKLEEAQIKIDEARADVSKIEKATWYIQDRKSNSGYTNIFDAIDTMANIAKMFPIIFYLVAVLISLTSMTRMIEEERIEIGTLKSLGYNNFHIILKYITYAFLACVVGGILGMIVGFNLIPAIVWKMYSILYKIPKFYTSYYWGIGFTGTLLAFVCIGGATVFVAYKELKQMPSTLMRPKAPKNGKKIILERVGFIWKRLNFSKKVTARNIFRYKARAIITIVGIAGCTGLMLTGFGIRDSVVKIPDAQFGGIFKYNSTVTLTSTEHYAEIKDYLDNSESVEDFVNICASKGELKSEKLGYNVTIFVPESSEELSKVCELKYSKTGGFGKTKNSKSAKNDENGEFEKSKDVESVKNVEHGGYEDVRNNNISEKINLTNNGIVITNKIADMLGIKVNDEIDLVDSNDVVHKVRVEAIAENYVAHYVYMTKEYYEEHFEEFKTNMLLVNNKDMTEEQSKKYSEDLLRIDGVANVSIMEDLIKQISDMLNTMNYVVVVLIVASAILAFVVLYNLANINIGERQRELATLKVLGFYDKEVDNYINKENIIFTIFGVLIGLVFGNILTSVIISSIAIDNLYFAKNIDFISYVYSAVITVVFSLIVNGIIHFILKKIDMIESLKSVE